MRSSFLKLALSLAAVSSLSFAEGLFVGVDGGYDLQSKLKLAGESVKDARPNLGLKFGYDFDIARVYASYEYGFEAKDKIGDATIKWKNHKFLLNADYTPEIASDVKLILGGYMGVSSIDIKIPGIGDTDGKNFIIGAKLGAEYVIDTNNAVEIGVKTDYTKYDIEGDSEKLKQTNTGLYVGYNYKF